MLRGEEGEKEGAGTRVGFGYVEEWAKREMADERGRG